MAKDDQNADLADLAAPLARPGHDASRRGAEAALLGVAADLSVSLSLDGIVADVTTNAADLRRDGAEGWIGRPLADLVTVESKPKVASMVADAIAGIPPRWRQVTHVTPNGEVPIRYACVRSGEHILAVGHDLRATAAVQQRLLQAQQAMERDYLKLRHAETRYRLMFDVSDEGVIIVDAANRRITDANPAAHRLLDLAPGTLPRQPAATIVSPDTADDLVALLGAAGAGADATGSLTLRNGGRADISATAFRQDRATFLLLRLGASAPADRGIAEDALSQAVERMPDAFVLTDGKALIVTANAAFAELAECLPQTLVGAPLDRWLGRPGVDLELLLAELRKSGSVRNFATIVRGALGSQEEAETSAVVVESDGVQHIGFVIRGVSRRLRDLLPAERDLPRSVEQLTSLVGRMSLREIVRESSDLIERLCIEAALSHTSDNRASAAEILGLSRQGLYSKLHRHGLGNLLDEN